MLINEAMLIERKVQLAAAANGYSESGQGYAKGFKPKSVITRLGTLDLQMPPARDTAY